MNVKSQFTSRFPEGNLIEIDLSQIEIVTQAILSKDDNLINDINKGIDFHTKRLSYIHPELTYEELKKNVANTEHWKNERTKIKRFSFNKQYVPISVLLSNPSKRRHLAAGVGMDEELALSVIIREDNDYPKVKEWQDELIYLIYYRKYYSHHDTKTNLPIHKSKYKSITGRIYTFTENKPHYMPSNKKIVSWSFNDNEIINFPNQGLAAEINKLVCWELRKAIHKCNLKKPCLFVVPVHDSILLDTEYPSVDIIIDIVKEVYSQIPALLFDTYDIDTDIKIGYSIKAGPSWDKMKEVKL